MNKVEYTLYLVTDREVLRGRDLVQSVEAAIKGGVTMVQLREKSVSTREFLQLAQQVKAITSHYRVPLIINDRLDVALAVEADGLHVGQDDMPMETARRLLGKNKLIGVSVSNLDEAVQAEAQGADYLGVGAIFTTPTKTDAKLVSLAELATIKQSVKIPVVAIGGINGSNAQQVMAVGIDGVSVVSAILGKKDIAEAARTLRQTVSYTN